MIEENGKKRKTVGVALSGGFVRGAAAIGVLEVLRLNNIPIDMISGCSAGSGIAGAFCNGKLEDIKHRLINSSRKEYFNIVVEPTLPREGFLKGQKTRKFFKEYVGDGDFKDFDIPLFITATDIKTLQPVVLNEGKVYEAIQASIGVPGFWTPVKHKDMVLIDGGHFNQIPSQALYDNGADYVIAIDSSRTPNIFTRTLAKLHKMIGVEKLEDKIYTKDPKIFELARRSIYLSASKINNFYHTSYNYDALIKPSLSGYKRYQVKKVRDIVEEGRKATEKVIPQIKKDLGL